MIHQPIAPADGVENYCGCWAVNYPGWFTHEDDGLSGRFPLLMVEAASPDLPAQHPPLRTIGIHLVSIGVMLERTENPP